MITSPQLTTLGVIGGAAAAGGKLILVGACLVVGFSIGNAIIGKINNTYTKWHYARQEKKNPEPEEQSDADNG